MSDDRRPMSDDRRPMSDDRRPMSDDRRPMSDDRRPMSDDRRPMSDDRRPRLTLPDSSMTGPPARDHSPSGQNTRYTQPRCQSSGPAHTTHLG